MAQILHLPKAWAARFEQAIRKFIWKGQPWRNPLPLDTVCLSKDNGGLNIPHLRLKCDALLLRQALRIITLNSRSKDHLGFWFGAELGNFGFDIKFDPLLHD